MGAVGVCACACASCSSSCASVSPVTTCPVMWTGFEEGPASSLNRVPRTFSLHSRLHPRPTQAHTPECSALWPVEGFMSPLPWSTPLAEMCRAYPPGGGRSAEGPSRVPG
eukprot:2525370-Prymnesium_polylepis.1